jgi:uncharacterized membrane protein YeaQ/YmgE (transglycosylase-associated protein family)
MLEAIVQMGPMLLVAGAFTGWLAEASSRAGGYGLIPDMIVGVVGSVVGGTLVWTLVSTQVGMLGMALVGCAAAAGAILAQRRGWRSGRLAT